MCLICVHQNEHLHRHSALRATGYAIACRAVALIMTVTNARRDMALRHL